MTANVKNLEKDRYTEEIKIDKSELNRLLSAANADAALLFLYLRGGNDPQLAEQTLRLSQSRLACADATLRQLGLWQPEEKKFIPGERPAYSEQDVIAAMHTDMDFKALYGEIQQRLGKTLNTEEMKIILGFTNYLGLPGDVVSVLVCYCKERNRRKGNLRNPSLRTIEKAAYAWSEQGIDTLEEAAAWIQAQNLKESHMERLKQLLQIRGRNLTPGEERYAAAWLDMGFEDAVLSMAYERTCLNTGHLSWAYMHKILTRWHEAGLHTAQAVKGGERRPPKGAEGELGQAELEAIARMMKEN